MFVAVLTAGVGASAQLTTDSLAQTATPDSLANALVGAGVTVSNVTYSGGASSAGTFAGGTGIIGFESGVVLSSGLISTVTGPNTSPSATTSVGTAGDGDLSSLSGVSTFDAAILEFDFVADAEEVFFQYVFASEEYNEFVNTQFNDAFAFFVNGTNCAVVGDPAVPVSINTINNGNPVGMGTISNPDLYINNEAGALNTQMDGLTVVLTCQAAVIPNATNHMKLAIADGSDRSLDSNVFLRAGSFTTTPPSNECPLSQGYWKTHAEHWPTSSLTLGGKSYSKDELLAILNQPVKRDASLILGKQLAAALLNVANGSNPAPASDWIDNANALLTTYPGKLPLAVRPATVNGQAMTSLGFSLDGYNNNALTENCGTVQPDEEPLQ